MDIVYELHDLIAQYTRCDEPSRQRMAADFVAIRDRIRVDTCIGEPLRRELLSIIAPIVWIAEASPDDFKAVSDAMDVAAESTEARARIVH